MMRSLYSGVSGLKTHQTKMDVIGNNIANVNTTAYKSQSITFNELMYQTTKRASGASTTTGVGGTNAGQIGLGVKVGAINTNITNQGATQTTNLPFDIAITGDSFFVVSNGSETFFTRAGSFYVDGAGNLAMTSTGYNVMGWQTDPTTGEIKKDTVTALKVMSEANMTYPPEATTMATITGIVDKNSTDLNSTSGKIMNLEFYDNLGYKYTARFSAHISDADAGQYYVQLDDILDSNGKSIGTDKLAGVTFGSTQIVKTSSAYLLKTGADAPAYSDTATPPTVAVSITTDTTTNPVTVVNATFSADATYTVDGSGNFTDGTNPVTKAQLEALYGLPLDGVQSFTVSADGTLTVTSKEVSNAIMLEYIPGTGAFARAGGNIDGKVTLGFADGTLLSNFENIQLDFSTTLMSNKNGSCTLGAERGGVGTEKGLGTGRKLGEMNEIIVQDDGKIYANYDNGQSRLLGQIATATFANPSGLEKKGDNLYAASMNSGEFNGIGEDIKVGGGYMTSGVLEMSNVDLSSEFTEMITTQRGFQANSRIITVSDTLLEELTNLKR